MISNELKEYIEDHRASSNHEPRSIYGKIVSTADRNITIESCLSRSYFYSKKLNPTFTDEQLFEGGRYLYVRNCTKSKNFL